MLALPPEVPNQQINGCGSNVQGCGILSLPDSNLMKDAVEPRTGIKFPTILDNNVFGQDSLEVVSSNSVKIFYVTRVITITI